MPLIFWGILEPFWSLFHPQNGTRQWTHFRLGWASPLALLCARDRSGAPSPGGGGTWQLAIGTLLSKHYNVIMTTMIATINIMTIIYIYMYLHNMQIYFVWLCVCVRLDVIHYSNIWYHYNSVPYCCVIFDIWILVYLVLGKIWHELHLHPIHRWLTCNSWRPRQCSWAKRAKQ